MSTHPPGMARLALSLVLALLLAACTASPRSDKTTPSSPIATDGSAPQPEDSAPPPPGSGLCDASAVQGVVGKTASADLVEQARKDAGAAVARVLTPGQVVTMEFRGDRLNLSVDAGNSIERASCG